MSPGTIRLVEDKSIDVEQQDMAQGYDLGVNSCIKPVDFEQFAIAVEHLGLRWPALNQSPEAKGAKP